MPPDSKISISGNEASVNEVLDAYDRLYGDIYKEADELGVPTEYPAVIDPDTNQYFTGMLPSNMHRASDEELGKYLTLVVQFIDRHTSLESKYRIKKETAEAGLKKVKAHIRESIVAKSEASKDRLMELNRDVIDAELKQMYYDGIHHIVENAVNTGKKNFALISRLIAQREGEEGLSNRLSAVNAQRKQWRR